MLTVLEKTFLFLTTGIASLVDISEKQFIMLQHLFRFRFHWYFIHIGIIIQNELICCEKDNEADLLRGVQSE